MFTKFEKHTEMIGLADAGFLQAEGIGTVELQTESYTVELLNVLYVPKLKGNFISVSNAVANKCTVNFDAKNAKIMRNGICILKVNRAGGLYTIEIKHNRCYAAVNANALLWHQRYGHLNYASLMDMVNKGLVRGMDKIDVTKNTSCKTCMISKVHVQPFPQASESRAQELLELVHTDVCGPFETQSIGGSRYFLTFIDDMSRRTYVYFLKGKDEVFDKFMEYKNLVERQTGKRLKCVRSDNGREYVNKKFDEYFKEMGIAQQLTVAYTPQQNGVAERANRTLVEMARCLLVQSGLGQELWAEAIYTAVYLRNRSPTKALIGKTPMEEWTGKKPNISHLKVFGSFAVALDKGQQRSKFKPKGKEYRMVGYSTNSKGYRLYDPELRKVVEKRDVVFDELGLPEQADADAECVMHKLSVDECHMPNGAEKDDNDEITSNDDTDASDTLVATKQGSSDEFYASASEELVLEEQAERIGPGRPRLLRTGRPGRPKKQYNVLSAMVTENVTVPSSYEEAMKSPEATYWREAMAKEYESLITNQTWQVAELPMEHRAIGCKWVFNLKRDALGQIQRFKARLVAKGCSHQYCVKYKDTFSPACSLESMRFILALAAELELYLHQMDVCTA
jgi:transposase InsO family protein